MNVLLVSPTTPDTFWSFKHALKFVSRKAAFPPLGLLTIAALLPNAWNRRLVDLNVAPLEDDALRWADYVMVGGMIVHRPSVEDIIARARRMGKPVIGGGPLFTTGYEEFSDVHCVVGEAEELMGTLAADMEAGSLQMRYVAPGRPDIRRSPVPDWDLIDLRDYATMPVQFSRGCPYDCEFCDVTIMNGRRPRSKSPQQVLAELDALVDRGWREPVFLVDDNFIGNKARVKELLRELICWRAERRAPLEFFTQASLNLADDPELLDLMVRAGFRRVFLGIETPHSASLDECHKVQNARRDLAESVRTIHRAGIEVMGGFIVGFDSDPREIFDLQYDFIQRTGIATAMVGLLTALPKTKLHERLAHAGRLLAGSTGNNTQASLNFIPALESDYLTEGYRWLMQALYDPPRYYARVLTFLREYRLPAGLVRIDPQEWGAFFKSLWWLGIRHSGRRAYWKFLATVLLRCPTKLRQAVTLAVWGHHFRLVSQSL